MNQLKQKLVTASTITAMAETKEMSPNAFVQQIIASRKHQLEQVLPKLMETERFQQIALNSIRNTPKLMDCTAESFIGGIMTCSTLGLEPNTVMGHAYLIPFWNSSKRVYEVQFIAGYRGLVDLARRSGALKSIAAQVVRAGDTFEYEYGLDERLRHIPSENFNPDAEITHAYAYASLEGGYKQFVVMPRGQVLSIRDNSNGYQAAMRIAERYNKPPRSPWIDHEDQMFAKTAVRRLYKLLPSDFKMRQIEALDAIADSGRSQQMDRVYDGEVVDHTLAKTEPVAIESTPPDPDGDTPEGRKIPSEVNGKALTRKQQIMLQDHGFFPDEENQSIVYSQNGEKFDPKKHVATEDGAPVMNANFTFRKRPMPRSKPDSQPGESK